MTFYLVAGHGASTEVTVSGTRLPTGRARRYPSDTTAAEWQVLAPLIPTGRPGIRGGRPPVHSRRGIMLDAYTHVGGLVTSMDQLPVGVAALLVADACNVGLTPVIRPNDPVLGRDRLNKVNLSRIVTHWPEMLRVVGSLITNRVRAYDLLRMLTRDGHPPRSARLWPSTGASPRRCTCWRWSTRSTRPTGGP